MPAIILVVSCFSAWITHIVYCLSVGKWGFLIAGAILPPIGVVHGVMVWMGIA